MAKKIFYDAHNFKDRTLKKTVDNDQRHTKFDALSDQN
jgi:hypothetical protein